MTTTSSSKPSEVGWQFVSQYYTFVNKQPSRLHCFYTKNSAFLHGTEGEDEETCYGQQEIHEKIVSIGFQDCKVYIHSVDAQASANNGIIIQAIGEMSNNNEAWRKFSQTFFLAEQPNGYFVLNDIFRYLKEESDDDVLEDEEEEAAGAVAAGVVDEPVVPEPAPGVETNYHPNPQQQSRADPPPAIEPKLEEVVPIANGNGVHHDVPSSPESVPAEPTPVAEETPAVEPAAEEPEATPEPEASEAPAVEEPAVEEPAPTPAAAPAEPAAPPAAQPSPAPAPAPKPAEPAKPKTWANLAASKPNAWGSALATDSKGVSAAAAPPPPSARPSGVPIPRAPSSAQTEGQPPALAAANSITTPQCFVKGVIETVETGNLRAVLTARFGPVKELEIVRSKACAFLEFEKLDAAKRAIIASLPAHLGGEGGVRIGNGDPAVPNHDRDAPRISIETRKERGERPPSKPRGGAPAGGERGGFRGGPGRGRGNPRGAPPVGGGPK